MFYPKMSEMSIFTSKNFYRKIFFLNSFFAEVNCNVFFLFSPDVLNRCNLLIAVASPKSPFSIFFLGPESCFTKKCLK